MTTRLDQLKQSWEESKAAAQIFAEYAKAQRESLSAAARSWDEHVHARYLAYKNLEAETDGSEFQIGNIVQMKLGIPSPNLEHDGKWYFCNFHPTQVVILTDYHGDGFWQAAAYGDPDDLSQAHESAFVLVTRDEIE